MRRIELFYDVVSPYTYFAFKVLTRYQEASKIRLTLRPFFLGGVMNATGNKPPGTVPSKARYLLHDVALCSPYFGVPTVKMPKVFPLNTLPAQRLLTVLAVENSEKQILLCEQLFKSIFHMDRDVSQKAVLVDILRESNYSDQEIETLFLKSSSEEIKQALKATTDEAVRKGAFGSPSIFVKREKNNLTAGEAQAQEEEDILIFGSDRFHILFPLIGVKWEGPCPNGSGSHHNGANL